MFFILDAFAVFDMFWSSISDTENNTKTYNRIHIIRKFEYVFYVLLLFGGGLLCSVKVVMRKIDNLCSRLGSDL